MSLIKRMSAQSYEPPTYVGEWPCRNDKCRAPVRVTEDAQQAFRVFSSQLRNRGEEGLDASRIVFCDSCVAHLKATRGDKARERVDQTARYIRLLKEGAHPTAEREAMEYLRKHHPDYDGFMAAVLARRIEGKSTKLVTSKARSTIYGD